MEIAHISRSDRGQTLHKSKFMNQRAFERIAANQFVKYYRGNILCPARITNVSRNGMLINSQLLFPRYSKFEIHLPLEEKDLKIHVKVARLIKRGDTYNGMGVELSKPSEEYLNFVDTLSSAE
jgi:hypothetical protein